MVTLMRSLSVIAFILLAASHALAAKPFLARVVEVVEEIAQEQEEDYGDGVIKSLPWEVIPTEEGGDDEND